VVAIERSKEICRLIQGNDSPVIIEIGSHTGEDTKRFLACCPEARVFCFDPDPRCCSVWRASVRNAKARLFEMAVGDVDGMITLNMSGARLPSPPGRISRLWRRWFSKKPKLSASLGQSSIAASTSASPEYPWLVFENAIEVKATRLDTWRLEHCGDASAIDLLWSDVQGAERRMIQGARETISMTSRASAHL
jgi:2-O-methyltransferase